HQPDQRIADLPAGEPGLVHRRVAQTRHRYGCGAGLDVEPRAFSSRRRLHFLRPGETECRLAVSGATTAYLAARADRSALVGTMARPALGGVCRELVRGGLRHGHSFSAALSANGSARLRV